MSMQSTSYWQVNSDGLKLNGAAVGTTHSAIIDSGSRFSAGPTTDAKTSAASVEFVDQSSFPAKSTPSIAVQRTMSAHNVGGVNNEHIVKDLAISFSSRASLFGLTAIDVPVIRGKSWILVDVFMRKYRVKFDVRRSARSTSRGEEVNGQSSAEMTRQVDFPH